MSLPNNIDLTENRDFQNYDSPRYVNGSIMPIESQGMAEGKIDHVVTKYNHTTHKMEFMVLTLPPWYTWKCSDFNIQDKTTKQTIIEIDSGVRFDGDIENAFVFGCAYEREDELKHLESFRAECLGHFCYECGKELTTENEQNYCQCNECREKILQTKIFEELNLHIPNYLNRY